MLIVSIDRLLWMRVCAMGVAKYRNDLELMRNYYYQHFTNPKFLKEARTHESSYAKTGGTAQSAVNTGAFFVRSGNAALIRSHCMAYTASKGTVRSAPS